MAIAISLVPPLAVVGLTLEAREPSEALGALLLFVTNVSAILAMDTLVMALDRVPAHAHPDPQRGRSRAAVVIALMVVLVAVPLGVTSRQLAVIETREARVRDVADDWAKDAGWDVGLVTSRGGHVLVRAAGPLPVPRTDDLRRSLDDDGLDDVIVDVELIAATVATLDATAARPPSAG